MLLAISTFKYFGIYDTRKRTLQKISINKGKYTGISWCNDYIYVAVGARISKGEKYGKYERIFVFDKNFNFIETIVENILVNVHSIIVKNNLLYIVNTKRNRLEIYDLKTQKLIKWDPPLEQKFYHFNTLMISDGILYLVAHNDGKTSEIHLFNYPDLSHKETIVIGNKAHNLLIYKDKYYVCDSGNSNNVISYDNKSLYKIGRGFVRGMAANNKSLLVGQSTFSQRKNRCVGDAYIHHFSLRTKKLLLTHTLEDVGNIYDIRILDEFDRCHMVEPFIKDNQ